MQALSSDVRQGAVIQHHDRVGVLRQAAHGAQAVVRVYYHVSGVCGVGKYRVRLDNLLREPVVELLEEERAQARAGAAGDGVEHHEALERVATVCLAVNHLHDLLVHQLARLVAIAPVVASADTILADVKVLGVVNVLVGPRLDAVDDARLEIDQDGARDVARVIALVVKDVLAVAALGGKVLEIAVLVDAVLLAELLPELAANLNARALYVSRDSFRTSTCIAGNGKGGKRTAVTALPRLDCDDLPAVMD